MNVLEILRTLGQQLRQKLHDLRIRILGKNAEEQAFGILAPRLTEIVRVPGEGSPQQLAVAFLAVLSSLYEDEQGWQEFALFARTITGLSDDTSPQKLAQACFRELDRRLYEESQTNAVGRERVVQAWTELKPCLEKLAHGARVPPEAPPEELARGAIMVLNQLVEHDAHLEERDRRNRRLLRMLVDEGLIKPEHARTDQGLVELRQALSQLRVTQPGSEAVLSRSFPWPERLND